MDSKNAGRDASHRAGYPYTPHTTDSGDWELAKSLNREWSMLIGLFALFYGVAVILTVSLGCWAFVPFVGIGLVMWTWQQRLEHLARRRPQK